MATKTKKTADTTGIPDFLLVRNRAPLDDEARERVETAMRAAGQTVAGEKESPEHAALRAAYGHQLPRSFSDWDGLRALLREKETAREERREAKVAARADMLSLADVAQRLGEKQSDVKRALRRDPKTLSPEARRVHKRIPRLAKMRHFDPADAADVCLAAQSGLDVLRAAGGMTTERRARVRRADGRVSFRAVVLDLRTERPEWRTLSRKRVLPALRDRWPLLETEQALPPADVEHAKAAVRAWLGKPAGARPAGAPVGQPAPAAADAPAEPAGASRGAPGAGKGRNKRAAGGALAPPPVGQPAPAQASAPRRSAGVSRAVPGGGKGRRGRPDKGGGRRVRRQRREG